MIKNNILKIFSAFFAVLMLFTLTSCGGNDKDKEKGSSEIAGASSVTEMEREEITDTTENNDGEIDASKKDNQALKVTVGAVTAGSSKDGSAKSGGKDAGKDSGKSSGSSDIGKSTGGNSSETSKPSGSKQEETSSMTEPEEKDNEGELVVSDKEIHLPVVPLK